MRLSEGLIFYLGISRAAILGVGGEESFTTIYILLLLAQFSDDHSFVYCYKVCGTIPWPFGKFFRNSLVS